MLWSKKAHYFSPEYYIDALMPLHHHARKCGHRKVSQKDFLPMLLCLQNLSVEACATPSLSKYAVNEMRSLPTCLRDSTYYNLARHPCIKTHLFKWRDEVFSSSFLKITSYEPSDAHYASSLWIYKYDQAVELMDMNMATQLVKLTLQRRRHQKMVARASSGISRWPRPTLALSAGCSRDAPPGAGPDAVFYSRNWLILWSEEKKL